MRQCGRWTIVAVAVMFAGSAAAYVNYEYFEGTWDVVPDFHAMTPVQTGLSVGFDIGHRDQEESFGFLFQAYIDIPEDGVYVFYTTSDDGSKLYINGALVVNNDGTHGAEQRGGSIALVRGSSLIEVMFFEKTGDNVLYVLYEGPGIDKQAIPDHALHPVLLPATSKACCPIPHDGAVSVDPMASLSWLGPDQDLVPSAKFDLYFSADPNFPEGPRIWRGDELTYDPFEAAEMDAGTLYYWRVDVYDPNEGFTPALNKGDRWSFTTRFGLVASYAFEIDPSDGTGNGHDGTYQGKEDPNIVPDPVRGNVLKLNEGGQGDGQYVDIGSVGIHGNMPRTIAGWAKANTTSLPDWTGVFGFAPKAGGGSNYFDVERDSSGNYALHVHGWEQPFMPVDTQWHHFAATYDGITIRWYLDGKPIGGEERILATIDEFRIGTRQSHNTFFVGLVDDVAIWDYALSQQEIRRMVLLADFDHDGAVDADDLAAFCADWLADTVIPGSIQTPVALEDFERYSPDGFPPITLGWFIYLSDSGTTKTTIRLMTGEPEAPYGGHKMMRFDYEFPVYPQGDDWLVLGHRISPNRDMAKYDEIRFRIRYHADNTEDVGLFFHGANDPPDEIEHEAFNVGPFPTTDNPADPNQWHEIIIDLRNDESIDWQDSYGGVDDVHYMNAILLSVVNSSGQVRKGTLYFDDIRLIDSTPDCSGLPAVDLNTDCLVDLRDFAFLAEEWLRQN
ncbi:MAG: hypothetical protein JW828_05025 [Sedimentisphaerales bacterium]|nr:hypothetical protein [Sedimentisphaerales bacterium]